MHLQPSHPSGNCFIDGNHQELLLLVADLTTEVRLCLKGEGGNWQDIQASANHYIEALEQHFDHEELLLQGARFGKLAEHSAKHRDISYRLRTIASDDFTRETAVYFVATARTKIFSHELIDDQDYWPLFEQDDGSQPPLIPWSKKIETGDLAVDAHHQALINYINRLHLKINPASDKNLLSEELESLYAYSDFHFLEEEHLFETMMLTKDRNLHKSDHRHLLRNLRTVISETRSGHYDVNSISDYLKYWFLNHIVKFDRPAFESSHGNADR